MRKRTHPNPQKMQSAVQYKHDLGQHFLYDTGLLQDLVEAIRLQPTDQVLEIGAGAGTLTRVLCETAKHVISIEVDEALMPLLHMLETQYDNLDIVQRDIRKVNLKDLELGESFRVIANIPYNITSQIFDLFWGSDLPIAQMSVMVQKEVAEKLVATPKNKAYGLMSVRCGYYCIPEIVAEIPAAAFTPPPKVDSAFVNLTFRKEKLLPLKEEQLLWRLVTASYRLRRKTLVNALKNALPVPSEQIVGILETMGFPHTVRGEVFSVAQWIAFTKAVWLSMHPFPATKDH